MLGRSSALCAAVCRKRLVDLHSVPQETWSKGAVSLVAIRFFRFGSRILFQPASLETTARAFQIIFHQVTANPLALRSFGRFTRCAAAAERVNHQATDFGQHTNEKFRNFGRESRRVRGDAIFAAVAYVS